MNKKRITVMVPEGLLVMLDQELSIWEEATSKQVLWVLHEWVQKVVESRSQPSSNGVSK